MLINVLTQLAADTGLNLVNQRSSLVVLANRAAKELHRELECTKMFREVTMVVTPDAVVSLPAFVGELKGMRMHTNEIPFDLASIGMPRYVSTTLEHKFKNWRDLGESAVHTLPSLVGQLSFETPTVEDVDIVVNGETNVAALEEETVSITSSGVVTTKLFGPQILGISCVTNNRTADITIKDANGNELGILYNNQNKTRYKIVDVSQLFWTIDLSDGTTMVDCLYKVPPTPLTRDTDSFYAGEDYDEAWVNMALFFFFNAIENRKAEAVQFRAAALDFCRSAKDGTESGQMKRVDFGRSKYYGIFRRWRYYPGSVTNVDNNVSH